MYVDKLHDKSTFCICLHLKCCSKKKEKGLRNSRRCDFLKFLMFSLCCKTIRKLDSMTTLRETSNIWDLLLIKTCGSRRESKLYCIRNYLLTSSRLLHMTLFMLRNTLGYDIRFLNV